MENSKIDLPFFSLPLFLKQTKNEDVEAFNYNVKSKNRLYLQLAFELTTKGIDKKKAIELTGDKYLFDSYNFPSGYTMPIPLVVAFKLASIFNVNLAEYLSTEEEETYAEKISATKTKSPAVLLTRNEYEVRFKSSPVSRNLWMKYLLTEDSTIDKRALADSYNIFEECIRRSNKKIIAHELLFKGNNNSEEQILKPLNNAREKILKVITDKVNDQKGNPNFDYQRIFHLSPIDPFQDVPFFLDEHKWAVQVSSQSFYHCIDLSFLYPKKNFFKLSSNTIFRTTVLADNFLFTEDYVKKNDVIIPAFISIDYIEDNSQLTELKRLPEGFYFFTKEGYQEKKTSNLQDISFNSILTDTKSTLKTLDTMIRQYPQIIELLEDKNSNDFSSLSVQLASEEKKKLRYAQVYFKKANQKAIFLSEYPNELSDK